MQGTLLGVLFLFAGVFSICGAVFDWDFFMKSRKAQGLVKLIGHNGARVFYGVLGLVIAGFGLAAATGLIDMSNQR